MSINPLEEKTVLFYAHVKDIQILSDISFYEQDIRALKEIGFNVLVTNKYMDILLKKHDYLYIWWWSYALIPLVLSKIFKRKCIITGAFHYSTPLIPGTDFVNRSFLYKILVKMALRYSDANIFVSKYEFDDVTSHLFVKNPKIVHHGIDTNKYIPITLDQNSKSRYKILMITWLEKNNIQRKGVIESIKAFDELYKKGHDYIELYIAGREGIGYQDLVAFISTLVSKNNIYLLGHVSEPDKISLLQNSSTYLCPTLYEGFGVAIAEALACGCPTITSDNGAVSEVAGNCVLYTNPHSIEDISEKILYLLKNPITRYNMSNDGRKRIEEDFSYKKHFESLRSVVIDTYNIH